MAQRVNIIPSEYLDSFLFFRVIGPRHSLSFDPIREWLEDESRPGFYSWGQHWLASEDNLSPRDCIEVAITDHHVGFEFKLRWC